MKTIATNEPGGRRRGPAVELNARERRRYSLRRAIAVAVGLADPQSFETDIGEEIRRALPGEYMQHGGIFVPTFFGRAGLDAHTSTKGDELVFTEPGSFITAL